MQKGTISLIRQEGQFEAGYCMIQGAQPSLEAQAHLLHPSERGYLETLKHGKRRTSYLLGRLAAKNALMALPGGYQPAHAIAVTPGVFQFPIISHPNLANYQVSLSHCDQVGIALVFPEAHPLGVDIETVNESRHDTLENVASSHEKQLFAPLALPPLQGLTILWTAREALSKVLKTGLTVDFPVLEIAKMAQVDDGYELVFKNFAQYKAVATLVGGFAVSIVLPKRTTARLGPIWHALNAELSQGGLPANR